MTNVSALPKNDIVSDAAPAIAANEALRAAGKPELAMVEVAGAEGDFPLGVTGKSLKRYLREKYNDLVGYLADGRSKNLATSAALA